MFIPPVARELKIFLNVYMCIYICVGMDVYTQYTHMCAHIYTYTYIILNTAKNVLNLTAKNTSW